MRITSGHLGTLSSSHRGPVAASGPTPIRTRTTTDLVTRPHNRRVVAARDWLGGFPDARRRSRSDPPQHKAVLANWRRDAGRSSSNAVLDGRGHRRRYWIGGHGRCPRQWRRGNRHRNGTGRWPGRGGRCHCRQPLAPEPLAHRPRPLAQKPVGGAVFDLIVFTSDAEPH